MKKGRLFFSIALLLIVGVYAQNNNSEPNLLRPHLNTDEMKAWTDSVFDSMTLEERIGQLFMPIVDLNTKPANMQMLRKYIEEYKIGGILYSKGTSETQAEITNYAQRLSPVPLFISLDGEWGLAMRIQDAPRFPRNMMLGAIANDSLITAYGREVGRECRELGIQINFAPVLDINTNPDNPVISTRAFGEEKNLVSGKSIAYAEGLESQKIIAVGKHFPGHGDTSEDSHKTLPLVAHDSTRLYNNEMYPFKDYVDAGFAGMLTAHLSIPALDSTKVPSSLSPKVVTGILKDEMAFSGLVFTDGLAMKGVRNQPEYCVRALLAGNDILLGSPDMDEQVRSVKEAVQTGRIPMWLIEEKCLKILRYKYATGLNKWKSIQMENLPARLNSRQAMVLNRRLNAEAVTLLSDDKGLLPLQRLDQRKIAVVTVGNIENNAFNQTMGKYNEQQLFNYNSTDKKTDVDAILSATQQANLLIVAVQSEKVADIGFIRQLCKDRPYVLVFFTSPYALSKFKSLIHNADAVMLAYENTALAAQAAAQAVYGGIDVKGSLSVSIPGLYEVGTGVMREKTRLGYTYPEEEGLDPAILRQIDAIAREGVNQNAYPGCQILVARNGNIVYQKSFGFLDPQQKCAVSNTDLYDLASVTKATATLPAVMRVFDEFHLKTSQQLSQFIPQLKRTDKENLTIRDALFHETGMPGSYPFYMMTIDPKSYKGPLFRNTSDSRYSLRVDKSLYADKNYSYKTQLIATSPSSTFSLPIARGLYLNRNFRDSIVDKLAHLPLKPRGQYLYSCLNFVMLRLLVENVSDESLDEYLYKNIYRPIGASRLLFNPLRHVDSTHIAPTEYDYFLRKQLLQGYVHDEIAAFSGGVEGNAGLFGNANDLAKLLQLYLNDGEYGGERFFTRETSRMFTMSKSPNSRRGLGFDKPDPKNPKNGPTAAQVPASVYGHTGFTGTCFWVDPDNQMIYIFLSNRVCPNRWNTRLMSNNYRTRIQEVLYKAIHSYDSKKE